MALKVIMPVSVQVVLPETEADDDVVISAGFGMLERALHAYNIELGKNFPQLPDRISAVTAKFESIQIERTNK